MNSRQFTRISTPSQQKGAVLFVAMMFLIVLTMLGISTIESTKYETRMTANTVEYNHALQIAEVGLSIPQSYDVNDIKEMMNSEPKVGKASADVLKRDKSKNIKYSLSFMTVFAGETVDTTGKGKAGVDKSGNFVNFITISDGSSTTNVDAPKVRLRGGMRILGATDTNRKTTSTPTSEDGSSKKGLWDT